uniref:Uncharacterized protein n=1 Tax=Anguilla anguilla TaxID=7936 RepID=A0A0E9TM21_ANGAN
MKNMIKHPYYPCEKVTAPLNLLANWLYHLSQQ